MASGAYPMASFVLIHRDHYPWTWERRSNLESDKLLSSKRNKGSKLKFSFQINTERKMYLNKKHIPRSKSYRKRIGSVLLKRKATNSLKKGSRTTLAIRKHVNEALLQTPETKLSNKQSPLNFQEESSIINSGKNGDVAKGNYTNKKTGKRQQRKRKRDIVELDEALRLQRRAKYLLIKMKLEQNLIDAYLGEGWKGQSREKIRPEKELHRAKKEILKCKLGIRDAVRQLDSLSSIGCIEDSVMAPDGSVHHEHIFCVKCKLQETHPDNDIILCDGTCNCAFHQKCLDPPLATENIPQADQGWLCKFCESKMEILEALNAHLGTCFSINSNWQEIFKEEAAMPSTGSSLLNPENEWPSDDSEDDDYDPSSSEYNCSCNQADIVDDSSDDTSSLSWSLEEEFFLGSERLGDPIPSRDSDDLADHNIINGRRQRRAVDYKKLYDEMFGKNNLAVEKLSDDEDWGPTKRKRIGRESDAASSLLTLYESENKNPDVDTTDVKNKLPNGSQTKKHLFRIPSGAVEKLRHVFAQNELPSRAVKEMLSRQLGLEPEKVNKWFKNARYLALKFRKAERTKQPHSNSPSPVIYKESPRSQNYDSVLLTDDNSSTLARTLKHLKKIRQERKLKLFTSPSMKKQLNAASVSPESGNTAVMEFSDDVCLKKQLKLLREKNRKKKSVNFKSRVVQEAEKEMERLCQMKSRLEQLKQLLLTLQNDNSSEPDQETVVYVPIAVLREV